MTDEEYIGAFLDGAEWWEYHSTGATMWVSDKKLVAEEARRNLANPNTHPVTSHGAKMKKKYRGLSAED